MPRPERPLDPTAGPLQQFAHDLRELRRSAGGLTYERLARTTRFSASALSDAARGERLPSLDVTLAYVDACGGDREAWARRWQDVNAALLVAGGEGGGAQGGTEPPYLGLAPYGVEDADRFFGRDRLLNELGARLGRGHLVAVFGPSGSGKSSLLQAGLLAAARDGHLDATLGSGDGDTAASLITPGEHPLERLERRAGRGLLVVDQFEEVFTRCQDPQERRRFIDHLLSASPLRVVIGMRADFLGHCAQHAGLALALRDASVLVGPMTAEELRETIVKPAARDGLSVDPALVATIVRDAGEEPGVLPLLSHALLETWRLRRSKRLSLASYVAAGGLHGAIARTAERVHAELTEPECGIARRLLLRLIVPGEGTEDCCQTVARAELEGAGPEQAGEVLERLARARLVTVDEGGVRIAHEALIRRWPRLREWLAEDREGLCVRRKLAEAARAWDEVGREAAALYRGTRLATARERVGGEALPALERDFLSASTAAEAAEHEAAERRTRRLRLLAAALAALLLVTAGAGLTAWDQRQDAVSRQLAAEATAMARLDVEGAARARWATLTSHDDIVTGLAFTPDGRQLASSSGDHTIVLWPLDPDEAVARLQALLPR